MCNLHEIFFPKVKIYKLSLHTYIYVVYVAMWNSKNLSIIHAHAGCLFPPPPRLSYVPPPLHGVFFIYPVNSIPNVALCKISIKNYTYYF